MAQANAVLAVQQVTHATCRRLWRPCCCVPVAPGGALIGAGHVGIEVGRVVGQQAAADQLFLFPQAKEPDLRLIELFFRNEVEAVPEFLRGEPLGLKAPLRTQDGAVIPGGDFGFRSGCRCGGSRPARDNAPARGRSEPQAKETGAAQRCPSPGGSQSEPGKPNSRAVASKGSGAVRSLTSAATFSALPRYAW